MEEDTSLLEHILDEDENPRDLPLQLLMSITDTFSTDRIIGKGGFGVVYKGILQDGRIVAVKSIPVTTHTVDDSVFLREVQTLLQDIDHPNVVRFLGFCSQTLLVPRNIEPQDNTLTQERHRLLCFEYFSNGNLQKHITDELRGLEWNKRFEIIKGISQCLQYLHKQKNIVHLDLKPANIMLDDDMKPKVTDFGQARGDAKSHTANLQFGTQGYQAPEYVDGSTTKMCDIYSLGVIIIELVMGQKDNLFKEKVCRRWKHRWKKSVRHMPLETQQKQVTKCIEIAESCKRRQPNKRPSISLIISELNSVENAGANISAVGQVYSPCPDDDDMLGIDPLELCFANEQISCEVKLTNETGNCVAFYIETPSQLHYCAQPNQGNVLPRSERTLNIIVLQEHSRGDEFIVHSMKVKEGLADEDITQHMFTHEAGNGVVIDEVKLTVVYDEPPDDGENPQAKSKNNVPDPKGGIINSSTSFKDDLRLDFHPTQTMSTTNMMSYTDPAVGVMTGAMGSLLPKLRELLKQEPTPLQASVKKDIESLKEQLMSMHAVLSSVSQAQQDQLNSQAKLWASNARELSYNVEDIVSNLLVQIQQGSEPITHRDGFGRLIRRTFSHIKWGITRHQIIAHAIQDIKVLVKQVLDMGHGYKISDFVPNPAATGTVDPRMFALYKDHKELFGIDYSRDELIKRLIGEGGQLEIISIFGDGGLGKTTLAKAVYDRLKAKFVRKAFVPVGRDPNVKKVFEDIIFELNKEENVHIRNAGWNERNLIDKLHIVLKNKRYLIVIDDIWDIETWERIKVALIDNKCGSRIIITSRNFNVAEESGGEVCKLEPLSDYHSKQLLYARLSSAGKGTGTHAFDELDEQSIKTILQKCGGIPLAITTLGSLLASKPKEDWPKVYNSIGFGQEDNRDVRRTRNILLFSYYDLPCYLKACLLHLSTYPEDSEIEKNTLVWKWVAEGFVREEPGKSAFKVGERYFNELVNRSMIQIVEDEDCTMSTCRVHDMVLDMICPLAKEEKFVTILHGDLEYPYSQSDGRILAFHEGFSLTRPPPKLSAAEQEEYAEIRQRRIMEVIALPNTCKPKVRSLNGNMFGIHLGFLLPSLQLLRVLSLERCFLSGWNPDHLDFYVRAAYLPHLRYLGLYRTRARDLPRELGEFRFLQTLDVRGTKIKALPPSVIRLRELKCLRSEGRAIRLPDGMGCVTSLEELRLHNVAPSMFVKELGKLTQLRVLQIRLRGSSFNSKALVESLSNLHKLEELELVYACGDDEPDWDGLSPSRQLRRLRLQLWHNIRQHSSCSGGLPVLLERRNGLPVWIRPSLVPKLSWLHVTVEAATAQDLDTLGSLQELQSLHLHLHVATMTTASSSSSPPAAVVIKAGAFPKLRYCYMGAPLLVMAYQSGAMPCLQSLHLHLAAAAASFGSLSTLRHLPLLDKVHAKINCWNASTEQVEAAEEALRQAVNVRHPNPPVLVVDRINPPVHVHKRINR